LRSQSASIGPNGCKEGHTEGGKVSKRSEPLPLSTAAEPAEDLSESDLPFKVQFVDWPTTSERFRGVIEEERLVVKKPKY